MSFDALPLTQRLLERRRKQTGETMTEMFDAITESFQALSGEERYDCYRLVESLWKGAAPRSERSGYERTSMLINAGVLVYLGSLVKTEQGWRLVH